MNHANRIPDRKRDRRQTGGSVAVEATLTMAFLVILALLLLKGSLVATHGQSWTVYQGMTDAYLTREMALAKRYPYDDLFGNLSPWPAHPTLSSETVTLGKMPGGRPVTALLRRTRRPLPNNLAGAGGTGDPVSNPALVEGWQLQSFLIYQIGGRDYVKSRTALRLR